MVVPFWILSTHQKLPHTTVNIPTMFHEVWWKKFKKKLNPPFSFPLDVDVTGNITAKVCEDWSEFNIFAPWLPWQRPPFWICSTPKSCHTLRGYSDKVSWSLIKGINFFLIPLFCFHGNCGKVCPTDSNFFSLSRSTRCGCCSYQVSSISVRRVTCYAHFCVFQFVSILAVSMATAAILKKSTLNSTISHGIWYSYNVS